MTRCTSRPTDRAVTTPKMPRVAATARTMRRNSAPGTVGRASPRRSRRARALAVAGDEVLAGVPFRARPGQADAGLADPRAPVGRDAAHAPVLHGGPPLADDARRVADDRGAQAIPGPAVVDEVSLAEEQERRGGLGGLGLPRRRPRPVRLYEHEHEQEHGQRPQRPDDPPMDRPSWDVRPEAWRGRQATRL